MTLTYPRNAEVLVIINSIFSSLVVYLLLSYILVSQRITIPVTIFMFTLILGLTRYYSKSTYDSNDNQIANSKSTVTGRNDNTPGNDEFHQNISAITTVLFALIFIIAILICLFNSSLNSTIFLPWNDFDGVGIVQLAAAIVLSFFLPGYALLLIVSKVYNVGYLLRFLLAFLSSMLITALTVYLSSLNSNIDNIKTSLIIVNLIFIVAFLFCYRNEITKFIANIESSDKFVRSLMAQYWAGIKNISTEILVFGSLLGLLMVSTLYIYGGITIGDQWYHQGRALLFLSGSFNEVVLADLETTYPPFQSALLAGVTSLSGTPLANTYASIAFLNLFPVIAFYYFFSRWIPRSLNRANLLASTLFAVGSGLNWIYFLGPMATPTLSEGSFLEAIYRVWSIVIVQPTNFIFAANPDFSTGLIYIALPAGFVLFGLVNERIRSKFVNMFLVTLVCIVGSLAHPEFYYFTIVSSLASIFIIPKKEGKYFYLGILFALVFVFLFDKIFPGNASVTISGIPLVLMCMFFVLCTLGVYMTRQVLSQIWERKSRVLSGILRKLPERNMGRRFFVGVLVVSVVMYFYGISFIISTQYSIEDLIKITADYSVPWFFYGIKLGIVGLLGLVFILSYFFKKFEKTIFIFGVIILVAVFLGPYYDEHRFSKFIMVGMIGFASLLVYKIVNFRFYNQMPVSVFVIPSLVICASISVLLFIGYNSLIVQTQDYSHNPKKNFPTLSEIRLFDVLRNIREIGSGNYNVISLSNEYKQGNLITRLQAFAGFPSGQIYKYPLALNATTLESFYRLLDYSDAKYIILEKSSIVNKTGLSEPAKFGLVYFPVVYDDDNYTVFEVPPLKAPSSDFVPEVALIYKKDSGWIPSEISNKRTLQYNNQTFNFKGKTDFISEENKNQRIVLHGNKRDNGITIWSKDFKLDHGVNYAELKFRIVSENKEIYNDAGLQWKEGGMQYYASISRKGLTVSQKQINDPNSTRSEFYNPDIEKAHGKFYTLKIESILNSTNVYVDDILKIQVPRTTLAKNFQGISNIGIGSFHNIAEFGRLEVGNSQVKYDNYYYPLSALALSKANYNTYMDGDLSALSSKIIVLTFDPVDWNDSMFNNYWTYVNKGGRLIIVDSDNNFKGNFSRLFSLQPNSNQTVGFNNIVENRNNRTVFSSSGVVNPVYLQPSNDVNLIASYLNHANQIIAPFAVEKNFSNGGSITLINAKGYYNEITKSPSKYFPYLQNSLGIININSDTTKAVENSTTGSLRFIGDLQVSGNTTLKTSSLLFDNELNNVSSLFATRVKISGYDENVFKVLNNISLEDLPLEAVRQVTINFNGTLSIPDMESHDNYFGISIPNGFNMALSLVPSLIISTEILNNGTLPFPVKDISAIELYNISSDSELPSVAVLLKAPEINVNGLSVFRAANIDGRPPSNAVPLNITGFLNAKLDFVDNYDRIYPDGRRTQYISYLKEIKFEDTRQPYEKLLSLHGIWERAKTLSVEIPWGEILVSKSGIMLLFAVVFLSAILLWRAARIQLT